MRENAREKERDDRVREREREREGKRDDRVREPLLFLSVLSVSIYSYQISTVRNI